MNISGMFEDMSLINLEWMNNQKNFEMGDKDINKRVCCWFA
jgi:hypothetical protein